MITSPIKPTKIKQLYREEPSKPSNFSILDVKAQTNLLEVY